jgi:ubiquinone/menaquinone biosynthesis C-methylase UbiE
MYRNNESDLERNIRTHNNLAKKYEQMHGEIYNYHEQSRLKSELKEAIASIRTSSQKKVAIDFGCGAGNLTRHLSNLGCDVIASDVSQGFLDLVSSRTYETKVKTIKLNGYDLSNFPDSSADMVASYSVLHHVPDYLGVLKEFMRVLRPGGIVYIDHELSEEFWTQNNMYSDFQSKMKKKDFRRFTKFFIASNYYDWIIRNFINKKYHREGDIHVFDDDHIEWGQIREILVNCGGVIQHQKSYLLFRRHYDNLTYEEYKNKITDMHVLTVRKI